MNFRGVLILASLFFLGVCLLSPRAEASVLGIDFGTEVFKGVIVKPGMPLEIVLNRETNRKTAAAVAISKNQRFFGEDALIMKTKQPKDTFADLLGLLGRRYTDPIAEKYRSRYPNKMVEVPERGTIAFELTTGEIFSVEELVGMILSHAKDQAEAMGQEPVEGVVLTVPPFFDQLERQALLDAASIAGLKILSLMNVDTAAALNFGMAKKFDTKQRHIFFDMGTGSAKASLVSFGVQQIKEKKGTGKAKATNVTVFEVEAVAFDREVNGREFDFCLQKILAERFQKQKGVQSSVFENPRAMAKILKEAQRIKSVLSANQETIARVEDAHESIDLIQPFTRKDFEESCDPIFQRVLAPLQKLIEKNKINLAEIDSVTLVGGGTRIPKVQALLKNYLQRDLGQNLNTDEAPVFGAAFRAAALSKRFRVKDIRIKDVTPYSVNVVYHSDQELNEEGEVVEAGNKEFKVFKESSLAGTRKQVSFRKNSDFTFDLVYDEAENGDQFSGSGKIYSVDVHGFEEEKFKAQLAKLAEGDHPKVTVVVNLDESGLVEVEKAEALFRYIELEEKTPEGKKAEESEKKESFSEKLFSYFAGKKNKEKEAEQEIPEEETDNFESEAESEEAPAEEKADQEEKKPEEGSEEKKDEEKAQSEEGKEEEEEAKKEEEKPAEKQIVEVEKIQKVRLRTTVKPGQIRPINTQEKEQALSKMKELIKNENQIKEKAEAFNNLEAHIYAKTDFLENEDFAKVSTEEERESLRAALSEGSEWLYAEGFDAETEVLREKLAQLKEREAPMLERYQEMKERPETIERLKALISIGLKSVENVTAIPEEDRAQTQEEIDQMKKALTETQDWLAAKVKEQEEKSLLEEPAFKVKELGAKGASLYNDLQKFAKKTKPKPKKERTEKPKAKKEKKEKAEEAGEEALKEEKPEEAPKEEKQEEKPFQEKKQQEEPKADHQEL